MPAFDVPANLAFDTYSELVAAINDWLDRSDLDGVAGQMIALCEARLRRELVPYFSQISADVDAVDGLAAFPTDFGTLVRVVYDRRDLPQVSVGAALDIPTSYAEPYAYTIEAAGLRLWPATDSTVTLLYQPTLPQLSEALPGTDLLSLHPDLYFYGALMFAQGYLANDNRAMLFKQLWDEALDSAKRYFLRQSFAGPLVPRLGFVP